MKQNEINIPPGLIQAVSINGLNGRCLKIVDKKKKNSILVVYGHHSSLERMFSIAENIADYGTVVIPDLPGFGGMDSFYKIGKKPTLDDYADYLATFIKLELRNKHFTIIGMSFGFVVALRMIQRYPEISNRVNLCVSLVGFSDKSDFKLSKNKQFMLRLMSRIFQHRLTALLFRYLILNKLFIYIAYSVSAKHHPKMKGANKKELIKRIRFEIFLWHINDLRSYMVTMLMMLTLKQKTVLLPYKLHMVIASNDQYLDENIVATNFKRIFKRVVVTKLTTTNHAPTVVSSKEESAVFIPKKIRRELVKREMV